MKILGVLSLLVVAILAIVALLPGAVSGDAAAGVVQATDAVNPPATERDRLHRPYPAPTGQAGFRKYYQKRCYPGCHYGVATPTPPIAADTHDVAAGQPDRPRYYKSYPAPTGQAGFRKYYQKRCYPGCHYGSAVVTPIPSVFHP